ncbi:MAG: N-acetylglucosamine/diacetylchitobiose ABC transporter substrate-binding protein [Streptosporangiales bacterium]|nr:N-acetylglucosamine/diacetylchitobiose ABC transporter substrate-binding protein [Streptosporangiales bacterium]MBO0892589.1 N-acetylglucosamine/diacetylchitobiose ABC transporter substrate-binding protein [Acidothermales bacterium]
MDTNSSSLSRRRLLQGSLAAAAIAPLGGALASCATGGGNSGSNKGGSKSASNPFGVAKSSSIEAVIFNGGYGYDYVTFASKEVDKKFSTKSKVTPSTQIAQQLQPRFVGGNPPDLIDNSGANAIGFNTIVKNLETLDDVFDANNYEGKKIADTLYPHVKDPGTFDGKFVAMNYAMTVYGLWYSASLFEANGWTPPKTWDEAIALGAKAKAKGKYLWVWGKEAATYYQTTAVDSAIKEGGPEVRLGLENLKPNCWSHPAIQKVFAALETCVKKGYFVPGGAGTQFTAAQAKWSKDQQAVLYPSGGWIENEMKKATKADFKMTGIPELTVTSSPQMPYETIRSAAGEPYIVPAKGKNVAGGKEIMRAMLSKDAATNFSKTRLAPTIVKGLVPPDGFGSTALQSQTKMLDAAGTNVFNYQFVDYYGMNTDQLVVWNSFLSGKIDAAALTKGLQKITDKIAGDSSVKKIKVTQ